MKHILRVVLEIAGLIAVGFVAYSVGHKDATDDAEYKFRNRSIVEVKRELYSKESLEIARNIKSTARVNRQNVGGILRPRYSYSFVGEIMNEAAVTGINDIKIKIDYKSKTGTLISSEEIVIYEKVKPGGSVKFKKPISIPNSYESFEFYIIDAMTWHGEF